MGFGPGVWAAIVVGAGLLFLIGQFLHLSGVMGWADQKTVGLGYYGLPPEERRGFKNALATQVRLLTPILAILGKVAKFTFGKATFETGGLHGPQGTCDAATFERAFACVPRPEDVFVVTQMKCGTTWMQQVVYEILERGGGDLVETGRALYAVSPWLEARKSVPIDEAPLVGRERPSRIIKTHLPVSHCPYAAEARYIYVARHPVSCFASCRDFLEANAGPLEIAPGAVRSWFMSDEMWWGPWTDHVAGWWKRAREADNVLFVTFEEMKDDLPAVVRRVTGFLGMTPLAETELAEVVRKSGFAYMREHEDAFEMHPPHLFAVESRMFVRGTKDRHADVGAERSDEILDWCRRDMKRLGVPLERIYPNA